MSTDPKQQTLTERLRSEALIASRVGQYGRLAAISDEVERLEAKVARVEALAAELTAALDPSQGLPPMWTRDFVRKVASAIRAALAEPERDEEGGR